jgi:pyruvate,water dikinase
MTTPASLPQPLIPLNSPHARLESVGGKGLNLIRLAKAGFPVPNGFLIPTTAYHEFVVQNQLEMVIADILQNLDFTSPEALSAASTKLRSRFKHESISPGLAAALEIGWRWLGAHPVAVRSSATAEDLPELSFAGQQDTFLNVIGTEALTTAVVDCWSSLWTARAIGYRARNQIPHDEVALSVVVQNMVSSENSGVLFTANPLNGRRSETVIDATLGLGEALVSGLVEPDHYIVDTQNNEITHKFLGSKAVVISGKSEGGVTTQEADSSQIQAIPDEVILQLANIGKQIEALYRFPQDIEWAVSQGEIYILQSRPITSLYPLPENLPPEPLKTMIGLHVIQGMLEPFTPLGQTAIMEVLTGGARALGLNFTIDQQTAFYVAGERVWINMTPIVRHPRGHKVYPVVIKNLDPGVAQAFEEILRDPRLVPQPGSLSLLKPWNVARFALPLLGRVLHYLARPEQMAQKTLTAFDDRVAETAAQQQTSGDLATDLAHQVELLLGARTLFPDFVIPIGVTAVVAGMMPFYGILQRFSKEVAKSTGDSQFETLYLEIARGLPNNVTTEMDLKLWETAQTLRSDHASIQVFEVATAADLASRYQSGTLPSVAQKAVATFMERYGMRGLGEIDLGRPRWQENPEHIMGVLQSYLQIDDPALSPDVVFARGAEVAQTAAEKLEAAVRQLPRGHIKARLVHFAVRRYRALAGLREAPKFFAIRMMGVMRAGLLASGDEMVAAGLLEQGDDLFYLHVAELETLATEFEGWKAGNPHPSILTTLQSSIRARRELCQRELRRKQIPRVLLSDGTVYYEGMHSAEAKEGQIIGDPVSPGVVEGNVRVVFNPQGNHLEPGEILVCPGTDPAWTPLFLAAGGLVMETGGMMTHGSVVAREYGIPAVVGVHQATERLQTGQRIRVDGASGIIEIL